MLSHYFNKCWFIQRTFAMESMYSHIQILLTSVMLFFKQICREDLILPGWRPSQRKKGPMTDSNHDSNVIYIIKICIDGPVPPIVCLFNLTIKKISKLCITVHVWWSGIDICYKRNKVWWRPDITCSLLLKITRTSHPHISFERVRYWISYVGSKSNQLVFDLCRAVCNIVL